MNLKDILLLPIESPMVMAITITLFVTGSITTFDTRLTQAKRSGALPADHPDPPFWINLFYWIHYGLIVGLLFIDWKYAIVLVVILFFLQVLPVLETSGNVLMAPLGPAFHFLEMDAIVNHGNSGGPVLSLQDGSVVGMTTWLKRG